MRPCLDCGVPTSDTRCPRCGRAWKRQTKATGAAWQRLRAAVIADHPWCVVCQRTHDLTVDHILPLSLGGTNERANLRVLCRGCHARYGVQRNRGAVESGR